MKVSEFRKLIREEIRKVLNEVADPLDVAFGKIYKGGDAKLNKFDAYLEKLGLFTIHEKWLEDNSSLTPAERKQLTTATVAFVNGKR